MKQLLVVSHAPTPATRTLEEAVLRIATDETVFGDSVDVRHVPALEATDPELYLAADGYLFGTPVNFGYISGALKHSFDCVFNQVAGSISGRPFSYWMHGRTDATGAQRALDAITTGLELRLAAEPFVRLGDLTEDDLDQAAEFGGTIAALLS